MMLCSTLGTYQRLGRIYSSEEGGSIFLRSAGTNLPDYTMPQSNPDRLVKLLSYILDITSYEYTLWSVIVAVLH